MMNSRRDFLQKLAVSAAAMPFLTMDRPAVKAGAHTRQGAALRVALMGLGGYASRVAEAMQSCKRAKITGLISGTPEKIKTWSAKYGVPEKNCYNYETFD